MSPWYSGCEEVRCMMNQLEKVLNRDISRLLERLADSVPGGCLEATAAQNPSLRRRLDEVEAQMATLRASMLENYGSWRLAMEDVENLWALAAWKSAREETAEQSPSLAA
jgi:hypothetical protein